MSVVSITGIPVPHGQKIPFRREVTEWWNDSETTMERTLFIKALTNFQAVPVDQELSYYQIAGIHGYPAQPWNHQGHPGQLWFCTHNMITFPTWHRPYMALYEQTIYHHMREWIQKEVPKDQQSVWEKAAGNWRLPYWDWAVKQKYRNNEPQYGLPELATMKNVTIDLPPVNGVSRKDTVPNPMYQFTNPEKDSKGSPAIMGDKTVMKTMTLGDIEHPSEDPKDPRRGQSVYPWSFCRATSRYGVWRPNPRDLTIVNGSDGVNNWSKTNEAITGAVFDPTLNWNITDMVSRLFTTNYLKSWAHFASTKYKPGRDDDPESWLSLEFIHNLVHSKTGGANFGSPPGAGHMSNPAVAAFDPIFWLHHCNIDRQFAIWQTLNPEPEHWFDHLPQGEIKSTDKLPPFRYIDDKGKVQDYTSELVRNWKHFGYQYGILEAPGENNSVLVAELSRLYNRTASLMTRVSRLEGDQKIEGTDNDYVANVVYDRYALDGHPYTIHFFLGQVADSELTLQNISQHQRLVGSVYTFSSKLEIEEGGCVNCRKQKEAGTLSRAQVPLSLSLLSHAQDPSIPEFTSLLPGSVTEYLQKNLTWKAVSNAGELLDQAQLPETKVFVFSGKAQHEEHTVVGEPRVEPGQAPIGGRTYTSTYGGYEQIHEVKVTPSTQT